MPFFLHSASLYSRHGEQIERHSDAIGIFPQRVHIPRERLFSRLRLILTELGILGLGIYPVRLRVFSRT
jgi:hypothetical protein